MQFFYVCFSQWYHISREDFYYFSGAFELMSDWLRDEKLQEDEEPSEVC